MSEKYDGGPAFPTQDSRGIIKSEAQGLSLRDYFAAAALQSIVRSEFPKFKPEDAMLEARKK